jgi:hypothetical protein
MIGSGETAIGGSNVVAGLKAGHYKDYSLVGSIRRADVHVAQVLQR